MTCPQIIFFVLVRLPGGAAIIYKNVIEINERYHSYHEKPSVTLNFAKHSQWILNEIEKTFNGTFAG